jgi:hypothetical protein
MRELTPLEVSRLETCAVRAAMIEVVEENAKLRESVTQLRLESMRGEQSAEYTALGMPTKFKIVQKGDAMLVEDLTDAGQGVRRVSPADAPASPPAGVAE